MMKMHERGNNHIHRSPVKDPEERKPFNSMDTDGEIHFREPKKSRGCYLSKTALGLIGILLIILIALIGVIVALVASKKACSDNCSQTMEASHGAALNENKNNSNGRPTITSARDITPVYPWDSIRLPRSIIPSFYTLKLKVDLEQFIFSGSVKIDISTTSGSKHIILHSNKLEIEEDEITVTDTDDDANVEIQKIFSVRKNQFYVIELRYSLFPERNYRIRFGHFKGLLQDDLAGLYRSSYKDKYGETRYLAVSQLQPVDARKVFPCFDEPDLKANFSVAITRNVGYTAMSNMPLDQSRILGDNWITDYFKTSPIMSTYLLAFVVAKFDRNEVNTPGGLLNIRIWSQPDKISQTKYALHLAQQVYEYFARYFDTPEVVTKADHVAIPDFSAGAMENWGLVTYRETALLYDESVSAESDKYFVSLVMSHEIAHTWFGNMVTMKWWDDLWLNEGFANTLMYFAVDSIHKNWKVYDLQLVDNIYPVMTKDALLTSHAISTPISDPDDIPQFFDSISYDKGMAVLRLLRGFLGSKDFQKGLKSYVQKYKFRNAEMSQLWETFSANIYKKDLVALGEMAGASYLSEAVGYKYDVSMIMDTWTRQMGFPVVTLKKINSPNGDRNDYYLLTQERFLLNPEDKHQQGYSQYGYKWQIPFTYITQLATKATTKWLRSDSATIQVPGNTWIIGNVNYSGFYRTNYEEEMWERIIYQLHADHTVFSDANRAGLINDAFNLARANKLGYHVPLNLSLYLHKEVEYVPWRAFLDSIHFVEGMLATSNCYGYLQRYIKELVAPQYREVGISDKGDLLERNLIKILVETAASVELPDAVQWAKTKFDGWIKYGTKIPPDYASVIYSVGVKYGGEKEWNYLWEKAKQTRVATEAGRMMSALGAAQEPWLLWRFARWTLDSNKVRMQDVRNHFQYYSTTPLGRSVALDFLLTTWDEINEKYGVDVYLIRDVIYAITSLVNTEFEYKQLESLYTHRPPAGVAKKAADNSLALIRSNINWMKLNYQTIDTWLSERYPPEKTAKQ